MSLKPLPPYTSYISTAFDKNITGFHLKKIIETAFSVLGSECRGIRFKIENKVRV